MYKGISAAYGVIILTYWQLAFSGYWAFGSDVQPYILTSLTIPEWTIIMANFFAVIQILGCYQVPILSFVLNSDDFMINNYGTFPRYHIAILVNFFV
uniref:Amino acid transporter transmembrane domain-containing protein n=1 Tax=Rhizophora mucronata TaxID=61149 RepID=A0A2P2NJ63_RHIMU